MSSICFLRKHVGVISGQMIRFGKLTLEPDGGQIGGGASTSLRAGYEQF